MTFKKHRKGIRRTVRQKIEDKDYWILMNRLVKIRDIIDKTEE